MNIIIHGTLAFDRIMNFPGQFKNNILPNKIHHLNVSFYINRMNEMRGGTGGNIAYTLAMLEEKSTIITAIGKDASAYTQFLKKRKIDTSAIEVHKNDLTANCSIITDENNNQITAFFVGAAAHETHFDFSKYTPENTIVVFAPANNKPDTLKYVKECKRLGLKYIFDPGQTTPDFNGKELKDIINGSYMFAVNDYELELVMKKTGLSEDDLLDRTEILITTLGKKGSVIRTDKQIIDVAAFEQRKFKDPTGAGDAYRGGLIKGIVAGLPMEQVGQLAACAASFAIEEIGTQEHHFTLADFRKRYKKHLGEKCPV